MQHRLPLLITPRVRLWNTLNEPETYACCGCLIGEFPPRQKWQLAAYRRIIRHMAEAHRQVCRVVRNTLNGHSSIEVGFSKNWTFIEPYWKRLPWDVFIVKGTPSSIRPADLRDGTRVGFERRNIPGKRP